MAVLLYKLNRVPDDEAEEIRNLLAENDIRFYETSAGAFGISLAAIWLPDREQLATARALLAQYDRTRAEIQRSDYAERLARGEIDSFWRRLRRQPLRMLLAIAAVALIAYVSTVPFLRGFG